MSKLSIYNDGSEICRLEFQGTTEKGSLDITSWVSIDGKIFDLIDNTSSGDDEKDLGYKTMEFVKERLQRLISTGQCKGITTSYEIKNDSDILNILAVTGGRSKSDKLSIKLN